MRLFVGQPISYLRKLSLAVGLLTAVLFQPQLVQAQKRQFDKVNYLATGEQSLTQIVSSIRQAQHTIDVTYFIYEMCGPVSWTITEELTKAANRGVQVRLIIDTYTHGSAEERPSITKYFAKRKIDLKYYKPGSIWNPQNNSRTHIKLFLFDKTSYVTGGRNIADDYFGLNKGTNWIDRDVFVSGPSAQQATASFNELWNSPKSVRLSTSQVSPKGENFIKECSQKFLPERKNLQKRLAKEWSSPVPAKQFMCQGQFIADSPRFVDLMTEHLEGDSQRSYLHGERLMLKRLSYTLMQSFQSAKKEIFTENWGYMPQADIRDLFLQKRNEGVRVTVVTNRDTEGYGPTDLILRRRAVSDSGGTMQVLTYSPENIHPDHHALTPSVNNPKFHSKVYVIDEQQVFVSSYNLDPRSHHTNLESSWYSNNCPDLAREIKRETLGALKKKEAGSTKWENPEPSFYEELFAWTLHELL